MDDLDRFYSILREMRNERVERERRERETRQALGEDVYTLFWVWCQAKRHGQDTDNDKVFSQYLKDNNIELSFWQKKYLAEKYFGYRYEWNNEQQKWYIGKVPKE